MFTRLKGLVALKMELLKRKIPAELTLSFSAGKFKIKITLQGKETICGGYKKRIRYPPKFQFKHKRVKKYHLISEN